MIRSWLTMDSIVGSIAEWEEWPRLELLGVYYIFREEGEASRDKLEQEL